ncbi:MAG TPA: 16S rRNA (guanine(966)-N(2))-methyltransferase RsmD [candidate division Zixibacteria bacterium]|jgi:16S rRNA (guanine(966)-N(2))-methyltransferase RsmD
MRIIAGELGGRRLRPVKSTAVRSTADRVKESLFNIIAAELPHAYVLDLFCGSGALGLESLSRGADRAVFVDQGRSALRCTHDNIAQLGAELSSEVLAVDAGRALRQLSGRGDRFSVIFADPPYGEGWPKRLLQWVAESDCRREHGVLVIEHHKKDPPGDAPPGFSEWTSRRFGDTVITIWRWNRSSPTTEQAPDQHE